MKSILFAVVLLVSSVKAFGFAGEWESGVIPDVITDVKIRIYNMAETSEGQQACGSSQCFRMDIYLNDEQVATWATSPGKPHYGTSHVGGYTPEYNGRLIHSTHVYGYSYKSYRYKYWMPYVMYIRGTDGGLTNYGIHGGYKVNGERLSHGCIRLATDRAGILNSWVREAFANGGEARIWSRGTRR